MPRKKVKAHKKTSAYKVFRLIERNNFEYERNFRKSHLQKIWNWTHSLYNVLHDRPHIIEGMRPVPYLLKVDFPEFALIFKVIPVNETKNFVRGSFFVGLHLLAGHRFEVRRFVKECVRANLCAPPNLFSERGL